MAKKKTIKVILLILAALGLAACLAGYYVYKKIFASNVQITSEQTFLYIPTGSDYQQVLDSLYGNGLIADRQAFEWTAQLMKYPEQVKAGRYKLTDGMTNRQLLNMLRSGNQEPVKVTFNNIRTKEQLAGRLTDKLEIDSLELLQAFGNEKMLEEYGFDSLTIKAMFLPNTYQMFWNTSVDALMKRMKDEYNNFWNADNRRQKAEAINLSPIEVITLASIVQAEQSKYKDEQSIIAGIYINRLNKNMHLESCPTVVYAIGDFSIRRVLDAHLEVKSPYNTYRNAGLPPGPINLPEISAIDAVLNYERHNYLFLCAKEDFSGRHYFSETARQHGIYAQRYHRAMDRRKQK